MTGDVRAVRAGSTFGVSRVSLIEQERSGRRVRLERPSGQSGQHMGRLRGSNELGKDHVGLCTPSEGPGSTRVTRGAGPQSVL